MSDTGNCETCIICKGAFTDSDKAVSVTAGRQALLQASIDRCDSEVRSLLESNTDQILIHGNCRRRYTKPLSGIKKERERSAEGVSTKWTTTAENDARSCCS